jgi:signal transduction histidine kinase
VSKSDLQYPAPLVAESSHRACQAVSVVAASYAIVAGTITLTGWAFDIQSLTDWRNDQISMFANTAACVAMCGIALLCLNVRWPGKWRYLVARMLATAVATVAVLTIFELITNIDLGIDTLLFDRPWGQRASSAPMRMGPPASMSLCLLGTSLVLSTYGVASRRIASGMATFVVAIASLSLIGYWFGADELFGIARLTGIAWQTSTMLLALGVGVMASMPDRGLMLALGRDDPGSTVLRRLIVPIIGIPLLLGWLRVLGQQYNLYDMAFGTAVRTLAEIVLFIVLLWWTATGISVHAQAARQAARALRESEQRYRVIAAAAKDADRRKDEFLATLAHELRNPLAPIGNALALVKNAGDDPAIQQQARETIERQFGQMVRLVDDLLDIGRITRDKLELRTQKVELASVIHQAVETSRTLADGLGHVMHVNLPQEPIWVHADPVRLAQVFINLLNNACKFTEAGGTISISAERQGGNVTISVKDTGIGIAPDKLESIFEMFAQVDQSLERTRGGLGIGLTIVKRLVELHGGQISVQSERPGRGSEFIVRLPALVEATATAPVAAKSSEAATKPRRILVTDDNRDAATSLALLLRYGGHEVEMAYDGRQAIEKAEVWRPEVMLLDLGMPEMNGYDVCRAIRQTAWGKDIQIVALTGWGQDQDRRNTREAGFDSHLVKPVDLAVLRDVLAKTPS